MYQKKGPDTANRIKLMLVDNVDWRISPTN